MLLALSYWFGEPKVRVWREVIQNQKALERRIAISERLIQQKAHWIGQMNVLKKKLTTYPVDKDVTADYLKILERVAKDNNVQLGHRKPQKEKQHGDLYDLVIDCTWESDLKALINFLYALEQGKVTMDIDDLTISLMPGDKKKLKGNLSLKCVYTRGGKKAPEEKKKQTLPEKKKKT